MGGRAAQAHQNIIAALLLILAQVETINSGVNAVISISLSEGPPDDISTEERPSRTRMRTYPHGRTSGGEHAN